MAEQGREPEHAIRRFSAENRTGGCPVTAAFVDYSMQKPVIEIDGLSFDSLAGFFDVFGAVVLGNNEYGRNLDAFSDVLRGGFGSPDGGFILRWKNSSISRDRLGYAETIRFIERKLSTCHPSNVACVLNELQLARNHQGETLFDIICVILNNHGPGGEEAEDGIVLELA